MKRIDISTKTHPNTFTIVDDEDYGELAKHKWCAIQAPHRQAVYVMRNAREGHGFKRYSMHRMIANAPNDLQVDHVDGNGLNNTRSNLRICTPQQNNANKGALRNNTSGYKGVWWSTSNNKWRSSIGLNNKMIHLGSFFCIIKAAKAYDEAAKKHYGEFAKLNFPDNQFGVKVPHNKASRAQGHVKVVQTGIVSTLLMT